ncbi:hypothetical protein [Taibaiella helva]|uniref:hypothetical protein n=1 Tax=Taibaiella helva TaxID=2301235 RepID=UPI0013009DE3|nr:hypothetical protein [Taibaiella helva]
MNRVKWLLPLLFLLAACSDRGTGKEAQSPADTGTTVPEDVVPESLKPAAVDSADSPG